MKDQSFMKTAILQWKAGEYYDYFDESELMEMFNLTDASITEDLYEKCYREYEDIYGMED